ncbi:acyltransferase family protein [Vibrio rumoiensis]|uniref:acyltransferase family protein n=1 Tax=Vibrio rumoiensis TaxID=76258 RepID=UPI003748843E
MNKERLFYVDVIKLVSALMVMLFHFNVNAYYRDNNAELLGVLSYLNISFGDIAISLFIIVSGMSLSLTPRGKFSTQRFFKKRVLAIYPSFWVSYLFVAFCIVVLTNNTIGDGQLWKLILTFFGLDGFFLYKMTSYYLVGEWYTGYMLITYLFFPVLFIYGSIKPFYTMAFLLALAIFSHINYSYLFDVYETCNPLMRLPDFFFGICFGLYIRKDSELLNKLFFLSLIYLFSYDYISAKIPYHFFMMFGGIAIFIVAVRVIQFFRIENTFLAKPIKYLAQYQFLAFLVHHQIILYFYGKFIVFSDLNVYEKVATYALIVFLSFLYAIIITPVIRKITVIMSGALEMLFKSKNKVPTHL